jgi:Fanconi-associated nuclease 1
MSKRRESYQSRAGLYRNDELPPVKRVKTLTRAGNDTFNSSGEDSDRTIQALSREEIPDSEEDDCVDEVSSIDNEATELESALPPVKTDKEAIADYELMRATGERLPMDFREHLNTRNWTKGRSSIYVDAFNLALETVLENESHLFDGAEIEVFKQWKALDYEAQYLLVMLSWAE